MNDHEGDTFSQVTEYETILRYETYEDVLSKRVETGEFVDEANELGTQDALLIVQEGIKHVVSKPKVQKQLAKVGIEAYGRVGDQQWGKKINPEEATPETLEALQVVQRVDSLLRLSKVEDDSVRSFRDLIAGEAVGKDEIISQRKDVQLTITKTGLKIGKGDRKKPFSSKKVEVHKDYAEYRIRALKFIVQNQDRELTPSEIWDASFGSTHEFDIHQMSRVRKWLIGITYGRQQLIETNGKRGTGSRYFVSERFNLSVDDKRKVIPSLSKELHKPDEITLQSGHCYEVSKKLHFIRGELESRGFSSISKESMQELSQMRDDNAEDIVEYKKQAAIAIQALVRDRVKLSKAKDEYDLTSPEHKTLDYLETLLDEGMDISILTQLVGYRVSEHSHGVDLLDEGGMLIWEGIIVGGIDNGTNASENLSRQELRLRPRLGADRPVPAGSPINRTKSRVPAIKKRKTKAKGTIEEISKQSDFEIFATRIAEQFVSAEMLPDKLYTSGMIRSALPSFTPRVIYLAARAGIFGKGNPDRKEFYLDDVIRVLANASGAQKSYFNNSVVKKDVEEAIQKAIALASKDKDKEVVELSTY